MTKRIALYTRVSTAHQNDSMQLDELRSLCERSNWQIVSEYREKISGTKSVDERAALKSLLDDARKRRFDKVVVWSVDRLGRSMVHLTSVLQELHDLNINIYAYKQALDTETHMGRMFWQIMGIFAEMENNLRKERQMAGIRKAQERGVKFGRPSKINGAVSQSVKLLRERGMSIRKIARQLEIGVGSVYKILEAA
ncbi:MAG: helix-turn-helix domain-containing protein [Gammaproteobacteria bacterium]|nr:helix-turn-helix domain-containing protein [Gammaproteobacteria bacterium]